MPTTMTMPSVLSGTLASAVATTCMAAMNVSEGVNITTPLRNAVSGAGLAVNRATRPFPSEIAHHGLVRSAGAQIDRRDEQSGRRYGRQDRQPGRLDKHLWSRSPLIVTAHRVAKHERTIADPAHPWRVNSRVR